MTKREIVIIGKEFHDNYYTKYHHYITKTYKYRGEIRNREEIELTDEGRAIMNGEALNEKVFTCPCCKEKVCFNDLEYWNDENIDDVISDRVCCSLCYENAMGEDL